MKANTGEQGAKVSIEDFDPLGAREKVINSPRSLLACEQLGIHPQDLFLWSEDEFERRLEQEGIESKDKRADYKKYLEEFQSILDSVKDVRRQLIPKLKGKRIDTSKEGKIPSLSALETHNADAGDDEDGEDQKIKSKNLAKVAKSNKSGKRRPRTAAPTKTEPNERVMKNFQTTQYLSNPRSRTNESKESDDEAMAPGALSLKDKSQKLSNSSKIHELEIKEQRRQANLLQSKTHTDHRRELLMRKILEGNIQSKKIKILKDGRDY